MVDVLAVLILFVGAFWIMMLLWPESSGGPFNRRLRTVVPGVGLILLALLINLNSFGLNVFWLLVGLVGLGVVIQGLRKSAA